MWSCGPCCPQAHDCDLRHKNYAIPSGLYLVAMTQHFESHTSKTCKGYLTKNESDVVLHRINWPPLSSDLNPVGMVWDKLDRRVKDKQPTSPQHMWEIFKDCWKKLVERMSRVCSAVVNAKGRI